jgi:thiamine-monophosphate kinase
MEAPKSLYRIVKTGGELEVLEPIKRLASQSRIRKSGVALGIGDDAALWRPRPNREVVLTSDWFLEGTHFLRDKHPPDSVGWKCLARAISDIAAMGGVARCFLLSLALPPSHTGRWLSEFLGGLALAAKRFGCELAGGDTTSRKDILVNVTVVGEVRKGEAVLRSGAEAGDLLFVSGQLGEAELGLRLVRRSSSRAGWRNPALKKHLYPEPRLALGQWLAEKQIASAIMDLSDGLSTDLFRLCASSGVGARVFAEKIPAVKVSGRAGRTVGDALELALHGGDDYELLFTVPRNKKNLLPPSFRGVPLANIGEITAARKIVLMNERGLQQMIEPRGWDPFRRTRK